MTRTQPKHKSLNEEDTKPMTENNTPTVKRPETVWTPYVSDPQGTQDLDFIVLRIGTGKKSLTKYEVTCNVPNVVTCADMTVAEFFSQPIITDRGLDGQTAINQLFRKLGTGPLFDTVVDKSADPVQTNDPTKPGAPFLDYPLVEDGHAKLQALMDAYELGRKPSENAVEKAVKDQKVKDMDILLSAAADKGLDDMAAILAMIEKKKGK